MNLRHIILSLAMLAAATMCAQSEESIVFKIPQKYLEVADAQELQNAVQYGVEPSNKFGGKSHIDTVTDNYIKVRITQSSTLQLKRLKGKKETELYVAVYTVYGPAPDSSIAFFDKDLNELPAKKYLKMPHTKDFFSIPKGSITHMDELLQMLPFECVEATLSPADDNLVLNLMAEDYVSHDDWNIMRLFLTPNLTYTWDNGTYRLKANK